MTSPKQASGSLVVGGSGLKGVSQFTLETTMHIEKADKVFYCVSDAVAEGFIRGKNPNSVDLYQYYSNSKERMDTYIQMAEVMLEPVRAGQRVVGIFYGHPGFFVGPAHRALAIAREEGYSARMLPGVSSVDCLFADLLVEPAGHGCQIVEATEILMRGRTLQTSSNVVLLQVGCIGISGFNFSDFKNPFFGALVDRLEKDYGMTHPVVDYRASMSPLEEPSIKRYAVSDLRRPEVQESISTVSTFYLAPKTVLPIIQEHELLNQVGQVKTSPILYPPQPFHSSLFPASPPYGPKENDAIASLASHTTPEGYKPYSASVAMQKTMESLSLNLDLLEKFKASPREFVASISGLHPDEVKALESGSSGLVNSVMRGDLDEGFISSAILVVVIIVCFVGVELVENPEP